MLGPMEPQKPVDSTKPLDLTITTSPSFGGWLASERVSLGISTYQIGKLLLVGMQPPQGGGVGSAGGRRLSVFERTFNRCMGLHASADAQTIWMASLYQLWRLENFVPRGQQTSDGYDALYVPTVGYTTGELDTHDIALGPEGRPFFCATRFNCLATISETHSFRPVWKPPFIGPEFDTLVPEDRCHLNGVAARPDGELAYATVVGRSDVREGWREGRVGGGELLDIASGEVACGGLSMPHSPRLHPDFPGRVWLLNTGTGWFGYADVATGAFTEVAFCPGFARGLTFVGRKAVVGVSAVREDRTFAGLPLEDNLKGRGEEARCCVQVIDLDSGAVEHWMRLEGMVRELYDVIALPGVVRPKLLGFKTDEIQRMLRLEV